MTSDEIFASAGHNMGNLAFHYAISRHIRRLAGPVSWWEPAHVIDSHGDVGILPMANQLGNHFNAEQLVKSFAKLDSRLVAIGLGDQRPIESFAPIVPDATLGWLTQIAKRSLPGIPNIALRGTQSAETLTANGFVGQTVVLGCPSLFISTNPRLGNSISLRPRKVNQVAVVAGNTRWSHLQTIEKSLVNVATSTQGSYVGQGDVDVVRITRGEARKMDHEVLERCRKYIQPGMQADEFVAWSERHGRLFTSVPQWMKHYRKHDFVVGTRYHGVALAIQAGVPGVVVVHDSRTLELCKTTRVPYVLASEFPNGITLKDLQDIFIFNAEEFDENRILLAKAYVNFLKSNGLDIAPSLLSLMMSRDVV